MIDTTKRRTSKNPGKVALAEVLVWFCPSCDKPNMEHFNRLGQRHRELANAAKEKFGCDDDDLCARPERVMCASCRGTFPVDFEASGAWIEP